jgi:tetratricopeptide (TPR) repeat protein
VSPSEKAARDLVRQGRLAEAVALAWEALVRAEERSTGIGAAALLLGRMQALGLCYYEAEALLGRSIREFPQDALALRGTAQGERARVLERLGRFGEADICWGNAQASLESAGDPRQFARFLCQRSLSMMHQGHRAGSLALLETAWRVAVREGGAPRSRAMS